MIARILCAAALISALAQHAAQAASPKIDFARQIKPILASRCYACHGPDAAQRKGGTDGLRLDTPEGSTADLGGYPAIVPGQPQQSALVERITSDDPDQRMPPPSAGKDLSTVELELIQQWITQGGKYTTHWAYVKPSRPAVPSVSQTNWPRSPIDYFLLARLQREGLKPSPVADRAALIRRVSLDLTGLPPTLEEVDVFLADLDPQAYEKLVDRLLAKPAYGEHWARLWLDLARYADSAGYADDGQRVIWLFRDYVIRSFNANKPFDRFTIEQIAGDLLPQPTEDQLIATAFHRNTTTNSEGGTDDEEFRNAAIIDRVNTTMAVWTGTTMACAQCHDHKYDPLTQEEYFRLFAFLNNTEDADRNDEAPVLPIYNAEQKRKRSVLHAESAKLEKVLATPTPEFKAGLARWAETFPVDMPWTVAKPTAIKLTSNVGSTITADGAVRVGPGAKNNTYTVESPAPTSPIRAIRLDALTDDSLPGRGPGYADGNFIMSAANATIEPPADHVPRGRYLRIELTGKQKVLSLAEVQVFSGSQNVALQGKVHQSSTDFGEAKLAIDGNTDGLYASHSTTHTSQADDPWWEVDLGSEQAVDRIVVWNRTDKTTVERLKHFRMRLLSERRSLVWQKVVHEAPNPSHELSTKGSFSIPFVSALADYSQPGLDVTLLLDNPDMNYKGWAIGGQAGQAHALTLLTPMPVDAPPGSKLIVTLEHSTVFAHNCLAYFRLSVTSDERAADYGRAWLPVLEILKKAAQARSPAEQDRLAAYYRRVAPELASTRMSIAELERQLSEIRPVTVPIMSERGSHNRRTTKIQLRGNFLDVDRPVSEGTPAVLPPLSAGAPRDRLGLAKWLVDENNPLTARVIANRYWEQIFGIGIVPSSEEFGSQGQLPEHPELLDWLATELIRLRWDTKAFLRLLVTSAAYRQSSHITPALEQRDPQNRLLAHGPRLRLSAEMVRDQALLAGGLLSQKMYGPSVNPPQPALGIAAAFGGKIDWQTSSGEDRYRRGLYTAWRRSSLYPSMATFDAPNRETCTVKRESTNTPLQALVTLNDPVYVEAAQALSRRVSLRAAEPAERIRLAFRICLSRYPRDEELKRFVTLYERALVHFEQHGEDARRMATDPLGPAPPQLKLDEQAALTAVSNVLLNLDEMFMKR